MNRKLTWSLCPKVVKNRSANINGVVNKSELFQITVDNRGHLGLVVESQVQHARRDIFLAKVVTYPEGSHWNMEKIVTGAVYDKKPGLHIVSVEPAIR